MKPPGKILSVLREETKFLIAVHVSPDGDALGSALALGEALKSSGKKVSLYSRDPVPGQYKFLPGWEKFASLQRVPVQSVLVLVDCNSPERAGVEKHHFLKSVVIDHHSTESDFGDVRWIVPGAAATGHMIYAVIRAMGMKPTKSMAENLYSAIAVDTGTFRYSNTSGKVLRAAAELVECGAEPGVISDCLYENWEARRFALLVATLNTMEVSSDVAITRVTRDMFRRTGTSSEDTENFSNFPRMINSVRISASFREIEKGKWRVSLRSKGDANVAVVAERFGGGGHRNAAGFRVSGDFESAKKELLLACREERSGRG